MNRASGILLHITSLPDGEGIGDLGAAARRFIDWLVAAGQSWWQMLPCGPVGYGESPYQSVSTYAGNTHLISLSALVDDGLLLESDLRDCSSNTDKVDYCVVRRTKEQLLAQAARNFSECASDDLRAGYQEFLSSPEQHWLLDYARYSVLKAMLDDRAWPEWPEEFRRRDPDTLRRLDEEQASALQNVQIQQFLFARQWRALREYASASGIKLLGDCPIYVAADSADVWCHPDLFDLDSQGNPRHVAGVPPDYFSATGQLWGNPLYLWQRAKEQDFHWWRQRIHHCASLFDLTRIDHFRGLDAYWQVTAGEPDASGGIWQPGPGSDLLEALREDFDALPLVAEDLGELTQSVHDLRERYGLPGMRVLQFGFDGGEDNPHHPDAITEDVICYTGTHDNNTTLGWLQEQSDEFRASLVRRLHCDTDQQLVNAISDLALSTPARLAVLMMQDVLELPGQARFNTPGSVGENWRWRLRTDQLSASLAASLAQKTQESGRHQANCSKAPAAGENVHQAH